MKERDDEHASCVHNLSGFWVWLFDPMATMTSLDVLVEVVFSVPRPHSFKLGHVAAHLLYGVHDFLHEVTLKEIGQLREQHQMYPVSVIVYSTLRYVDKCPH